MTLPFWLTLLSILGALALGVTIGWYLHAAVSADATDALVVAAERRGYDHGYAMAWELAGITARDVLHKTFPTSLGGRAIVRALGGDPGPMPRKAKPLPGIAFGSHTVGWPGMYDPATETPVSIPTDAEGAE